MLSPSRPSSPTGPAYLAPYLFFSYMYCSCLKNGLWTWWSKSFVTWYSLPGLSDSWLFFWLSLSRLTRAASCNTIQMEYSINSKAGRKRQALRTRPPPSSALSLHVLQQAAFCFGCFCCFLQIECVRRQEFVLERIVWGNPPGYSSCLYRCVSLCWEPRARTKQMPCFSLQHQNFQTEKFDFYLRILNCFSFCWS